MLATLFNWVVIAWLCFIAGARLEDSLWKSKSESFGLWQLPVTLLNGLACWAFFANILSLFWPLNWESLIKISAVGLFETCFHVGFYKHALKQRMFPNAPNGKRLWIYAFLAAAVFFLKSISPSEIFDEGAYYRPFLMVAERFGVIPGLGNLNLHAALNSSWHVVQALFGMRGFWFSAGVYDLNGWLCMVILGLSVAAGVKLLSARTIQWSHLPLLILFALPAFTYRNLLTGPSSDISAIGISWLIWIFAFLFAFEIDKQKSYYLPFTLLWLGLFVVTIKITSVMLFLPGIFVLIWWLMNGKSKLAFIWIGIILAILVPHLFRNYLLSGYLFYPLTQIDLFSPEWKVPLDRIENKFYMAQFGPFAPPESYSFSWLKSWFSAFNLESRVIMMLAFVSLVSAPILFVALRKRSGIYFRPLYASMLFASLVWFFTVTEPRYGFGTLLILALTCICGLVIVLKNRWAVLGYMFFIVALQSVHWLTPVSEFNFEKIPILKGSSYPIVSREEVLCGNFKAFSPTNYTTVVPKEKPVFCWDTKFPCLPKEDLKSAKRIVLRTNNIRDGFKSLPLQP